MLARRIAAAARARGYVPIAADVYLRLRETLEGDGYRVVEAGDGREALAIYREMADEIDVILTDVAMPNLGGPEFVAILRGERRNPRVLFMSGYAEAAVRRAFFGSVASFLQKPFTPMQLAQKIREVLHERESGSL